MNGTSIIYDRSGKPAVLTIAIDLIDDDQLRAMVNELLDKLGYATPEPDNPVI